MIAIPGFEDYFVSSDGHVISYKGRNQRFLKMSLLRTGYLRVGLKNNGKLFTKTVHRLVASAFLPNYSDFLCVNHINGIKTDNRVENLEMVNKSQNAKHASEMQLLNPVRGLKHPKAFLSDSDVDLIKYYLQQKSRSQKQLAALFNCSQTMISNIKRGVGRFPILGELL